ncbi:hypothetical protein Tfer_0846 [Thermincola ferriacetica]|uniref:Uncharacterized protein n=1 Tax=Thermincola ferriacetica TaxID=281456 RepID=A0A0L6W492_9FIRM|nr:hypothetical protein [Thermincola ferriacetica]KNZ70286.1 hypothetical protein Tfer_0846 [Thermincola ferriacetica]
MENLVKEYKKGHKILRIVYDDNPENPRDWDNLGTMVCFHRRYNLGDPHNYREPDDFLFDLLEQTVGDTDKAERFVKKISDSINRELYRSYGAYKKAVDDEIIDIIRKKFIILPLYLLDHSGITISTSPFSCPWDSGQVGWIYVSKDDVCGVYGVKHITPTVKRWAIGVLEAEVEEYDIYLRGEVYGYKLYHIDEAKLEAYLKAAGLERENLSDRELELFLVEEDSCWGFFGDDFRANGLLEYVGREWEGVI